MILKLKNVRQHEDLEIEIPDTGIVRIFGKSGAGKTTILDAIEEALYGNGTDITPWGSTKSSVELILNNPPIKILRTRGPHTLTIWHNDGIFKDDEAQSIINKVIGMTEQEFNACSYIKQRSVNSLLSFGPADQLRFVETLSSIDGSPDEVKEKIKALIRNSESQVTILKAELSQKTTYVNKLREQIQEIGQSVGEKPASAMSEQEYTEKQSLLIGKKSIYQDLLVKKTNIYLKIDSPLYKTLKTGQEAISGLQSQIKTNKESIAALKDNLLEIKPWSEKSEAECVAELERLGKQKEIIQTKTKIKDISKEILSYFGDIQGHKSVTSLLMSKKEECDGRLSSLQSEKTKALNKKAELDSLRIPQYCPICNTPLAIIASKICSTSDVPANLTELKAEVDNLIESLSTTIGNTSHISGKINEWITKCNSLKELLPQVEPYLNITSLAEYNEKNDNINKYMQSSMADLLRINDIEASITRHEMSISKAVDNIQEIRKKIKDAEELTPIEELTKEKDLLTEKIHSIEIEVNSLKNELSNNDNRVNALLSYEKIQTTIKQLKVELDAADKSLTELVILTKNEEDKLAAAQRLKELSDFAAVSAINSALDDINSCSAVFVEKMFPDDGTVIKLKNTATTKSGEERAKISLDIFHKGKQAKKLSNLSGGEQSRACLAFQLGLSELYKSPILMVDEGFSGLGDNDKEQCLEILHDIAKDKLLLVVEHGAGSSHFNTTISIGD